MPADFQYSCSVTGGLAHFHAFHASISRRSARAASGVGSRGQAREVEAGGQGVEGALSVSSGENAVLYGQRPEGFLPRLLLGKARQHLRLRDGDRRRRLRRGGGTARLAGGPGAAFGYAGCRAARAAPPDAVRRNGVGFEVLRGAAGLACRRRSPRLSRRPFDFARDAVAVSYGLRAGRALRAEGTSGLAGRVRRGYGGGGASDRGRWHSGALRSLPRSRDVS